jgi:Na+/melibiose symporter-like transporter
MATASVAMAVLKAPERVAAEAPGHRFRLRDYAELVANPNMWRIMVMDFFTALGPFWMAATYLFFTRDYMGFRVADTSLLLGVHLASGLLGAPAIAWLATRTSKHRAAMAAGVGSVLALCIQPFLKELPVYAMAAMVGGFMAAGLNVMTRAMTADVAEELRLRQGKDQSALLYAMITLTSKLGGGLAIFMAFGALSLVGYDPQLGADNTPEAIRGLALCFVGGPSALILIGVAALTGYRLTAARSAEIRRLLEARDREAEAQSPPQAAAAELKPA